MKTYRGFRDADYVCHVFVRRNGEREHKLPLRLGLVNHSPTGFNWGYAGSGPAQLALALLADATGDKELAVRLHQEFKFAVIAKLARNDAWQMTDEEIRATATRLMVLRAAREAEAGRESA